jgi:hypothetical protein
LTAIGRQVLGYSSDRDAMYGDGRLSLAVPENTTTTAGSCATASQVLPVSVAIDGQSVGGGDVMYLIQYLWVNGATTQGPIDISDLVRGKSQVTLAFHVCEAAGVTDFGIDVGYDNIQAVGLQMRNPGFEDTSGWTLSSSAPAPTARIAIVR